MKQENINHFELKNDPLLAMKLTMEGLRKLPKLFYEIQEIKDLYKNKDKFDLFVVDNYFNEV